ncbi:MAG: YdcF family protein [Clostridia bacterium]|nr:YdcF family protein [Clostridia bacterium]
MKKRKFIDIFAVCLGAFAFIAYISYLIKLVLWPETVSAVIICLAVMALTAVPIFFHKKLAKIIPHKIFTALKVIYFAAGIFYAISFVVMCLYISDVNSRQVTPDNLENDAVILVYGAGLQGERPGKALQKRLNTALELYESSEGATIIVSGGQGDNEVRSEAEAMKEYLCERGVPEEKVLMEDKSRNTVQNINYSFEIIKEVGLEDSTVVSVSNAFHIPRIILLCEKLGYESVPALAPDPDSRFIFATLVREYMSYVKLILFGGE